jgi:hypothetical protein
MHRRLSMKNLNIEMRVVSVFILWLATLLSITTGCTSRSIERKPGMYGDQEHSYRDYAAFTVENMENLDHIYSDDYQPHPFVVDTENGSTIIQSLIDTEFAGLHLKSLGLEKSDKKERLWEIYNHVLESYAYVAEPSQWPSVGETIRWKKGDCKGLSLLLMSLLLASGYDVRAEISNGHMWVNVNTGDEWRILELDRDPERNQVYGIPGFYENPLYKIYQDRTEKRVPVKNEK